MKRGTEPNEEERERTTREIEKGTKRVNKKGKGKDRQRHFQFSHDAVTGIRFTL